MKPSLSRAGILKWLALAPALAAGVVASVTQIAQAANNQAQFKYQGKPGKGGQKCSGCKLFKPPSGCQVVTGTISPNGWCVAWVKK